MAKIYPFRSLQYARDKVPIEKVVTQPYDKISKEMQDRYYALHPNNVVRIVYGKTGLNDSATDNIYTRAAKYLKEWREAGILRVHPTISGARDRRHSRQNGIRRCRCPGGLHK